MFTCSGSPAISVILNQGAKCTEMECPAGANAWLSLLEYARAFTENAGEPLLGIHTAHGLGNEMHIPSEVALAHPLLTLLFL